MTDWGFLYEETIQAIKEEQEEECQDTLHLSSQYYRQHIQPSKVLVIGGYLLFIVFQYPSHQYRQARMIEVEITDDMKRRAWKRARDMGQINNSITKGDGNIAGFLGEEVANKVLNGTIDHTYDYDIVSKKLTWDVKTKRCTSPPRDFYECSIAEYNTKQKCDNYVFVRIENKNGRWGRAWVLGWLPLRS